MRSQPGVVGREVATSGLGTWNFGQLDLRSRHHFGVATWVVAREVATWKNGVAT